MTPSGAPSSPAALAASAITCWWPRWTPSKLPMATAAPRSLSGRSFQPLIRRRRRIAASGAPLRDHDQGLAIDHGLAVDQAGGFEGRVALGLVQRLDGDADDDRVADLPRRAETQRL